MQQEQAEKAQLREQENAVVSQVIDSQVYLPSLLYISLFYGSHSYREQGISYLVRLFGTHILSTLIILY